MRLVILTILTALTVTGASAQDRSAPEALSALRACRALGDDAARLACFDQSARTLDESEASGDLVVVERSEIQETRQRLFGLDVPNVRLLERFGGQAQMDAVETTLARAHQSPRGEWVFELADGSVWRQIDAERLTARAAPGVAVRIRRAAMGSYFISIAGSRALRAQRDR